MKKILNPAGMFISGLLLGTLARLLDIYTQNLGNVFSQMAIWILLGVIISIYSDSKKKAMLNNPHHLILEAPHPSPLSAYRGFFGSKPFSQTNRFLEEHGVAPIDWQIENI